MGGPEVWGGCSAVPVTVRYMSPENGAGIGPNDGPENDAVYYRRSITILVTVLVTADVLCDTVNTHG